MADGSREMDGRCVDRDDFIEVQHQGRAILEGLELERLDAMCTGRVAVLLLHAHEIRVLAQPFAQMMSHALG